MKHIFMKTLKLLLAFVLMGLILLTRVWEKAKIHSMVRIARVVVPEPYVSAKCKC